MKFICIGVVCSVSALQHLEGGRKRHTFNSFAAEGVDIQ